MSDFLSSGSTWHRWEPHVHGPGTTFNDQFNGNNPFESYITYLETITPTLKAIAITDYYSTEVYEKVKKEKEAGRLPNCEFIFPNIEMRLGIGTVKGNYVNLHLLVNPEDPNHIDEANRFLSRISFEAYGDKFHCDKKDLTRLGKTINSNIKEDHIAFREGCLQFKVNREQLTEEYQKSNWAQRNILIAVSGGSDGSPGIRDRADTTLREEIEKLSDIIFASNPNQREFWLGKKTLNVKEIESRFRNLKPCLHGSDAHRLEDIGKAYSDRYTWIKGALSFDSLKQACIDPEERAFIGPTPPIGANPSQTIQKIEICNTDWCQTPKISLNSGLVAIIGARGSGKTALAEIIAKGCDSISMDQTTNEQDKSFLLRAKEQLRNSMIRVHWGGNKEPVERSLDNFGNDPTSYPMARYLSQQFVDNLCSSDGVTDKLLKEVERVIFNAHDVNQREGAIDFESLLNRRASKPRSIRENEEKSLQDLCYSIGIEIEKSKLYEPTTKIIQEKEHLISQYNNDRSQLVSLGSEARVERLNELTLAAEKVRSHIRFYSQQQDALHGIKIEVDNVKQNKAPSELRNLKKTYSNSYLDNQEWESFLIDFTGNVNKIIETKLSTVKNNIEGWKGSVPQTLDPKVELLKPGDDLSKQTLAILEAEINKLSNLVNSDKDITRRYASITQKIAQEQALLEQLRVNLDDYVQAGERLKEMRKERVLNYERVFTALLEEEKILTELYSPILKKLKEADGTLTKMSFAIKRTANTEEWALQGEKLVDLREIGAFKGKGSLKRIADEMLKEAWESGSASDISNAMNAFYDAAINDLLKMSKVNNADRENYRIWATEFSKWLFSTRHISINYSLNFEGVDIRKLSPGTRGIVLLLLYLALDDEDDSPLIIDQPEENLDPRSIFDELVPLFIQAKMKRQVIIVTHNANLVINTNADQIIIAEAKERLPNGMPKIAYKSGGLEEKAIRDEVCAILEGGERAFVKRAQRLRVEIK